MVIIYFYYKNYWCLNRCFEYFLVVKNVHYSSFYGCDMVHIYPDSGQFLSDLLTELWPVRFRFSVKSDRTFTYVDDKGVDLRDYYNDHFPNWPTQWKKPFNSGCSYQSYRDIVSFFKKWQPYGLQGFIIGEAGRKNGFPFYFISSIQFKFSKFLDVSLRGQFCIDLLLVNPDQESWVYPVVDWDFDDAIADGTIQDFLKDPEVYKKVITNNMRLYVDPVCNGSTEFGELCWCN